MSIPDFERAQYVEPPVIDGTTGFVEGSRRASSAAFPLALVYGIWAAVVGAIGYALIGLSGFMVSIVTIGIGWLVAKAMMTATRGIGGREYQVAAVVLTYFSASVGMLLDGLYRLHKMGYGLSQIPPVVMVKSLLLHPIVGYRHPIVAAMGLLILYWGLLTAWQMAAGSPGFGQAGGPRMTVMGVRR